MSLPGWLGLPVSVSVCCGEEKRVRPRDGKQVRFCGWRFPQLPAFSTFLRPRPWWPQARQGLGDTRTSAALPCSLPMSHSPETDRTGKGAQCLLLFLPGHLQSEVGRWGAWAVRQRAGKGGCHTAGRSLPMSEADTGVPGGCEARAESFPRVTLQPGSERGLWKRALPQAREPGQGL